MLNEFASLAESANNSNGGYIDQAGVYDVTITSAELSPADIKNPFLELKFKTQDGKLSTYKMGRVYEGLNEKAKKIRTDNLLELFKAAEIKISPDGEQMVKDLVGKQIRVLFREREYVGYDKDNNNKPLRKSLIEFSYCRKLGAQMNAKQSYLLKTLDNRDESRYQQELQYWEKQNASSGAINGGGPEIDLDEDPF